MCLFDARVFRKPFRACTRLFGRHRYPIGRPNTRVTPFCRSRPSHRPTYYVVNRPIGGETYGNRFSNRTRLIYGSFTARNRWYVDNCRAEIKARRYYTENKTKRKPVGVSGRVVLLANETVRQLVSGITRGRVHVRYRRARILTQSTTCAYGREGTERVFTILSYSAFSRIFNEPIVRRPRTRFVLFAKRR